MIALFQHNSTGAPTLARRSPLVLLQSASLSPMRQRRAPFLVLFPLHFQAQHSARPISSWQHVGICSQAHLAYCTHTVFPHTNLRLELATLFPSQSLFMLGNLTNFHDIWQNHIAGILLPQRPMLIILLSCSCSARMSIVCMVRCSSMIIGAWMIFSRCSGA